MKKQRMISGVVLGILPLILCVIYCAVYGKNLWDIYLPNSYWNDELLYFKQVEGILKGGVPGGYFGYDESRAAVLSFAVWSPVLMMPWVIWGKVFGWNFFSPVLCNLICMMAGMAAFGYLARPARKQLAAIAALFGAFTPFTRFIMSCTPEAFCCALILWYMGCLFAYEREGTKGYLWQMHFIAGILTLMRPYFLLFLLYPAAVVKKHGKMKCMAMGGSSLLFLAGYVLTKRFLSTDYLFNALEISFLEAFREQGLVAGLQEFWQQSVGGARDLKNFLRAALQYGNCAGSMYAVYGMTGVMLLAVVIVEWKNRKRGNYCRLALLTAAAYVAMMAAIFYIYALNEGSRHLMSFLLAGFLVLGMYSARIADKAVQIMLCGVICLFFLIKPGVPYDRLPPFREEKLAEDIEAMREVLSEKMECTSGIGWENTVIWLAYDIVGEEIVTEQWQQLYALPEGFGINYCSQPYVLEYIDVLQPRYIAAVPGGQIEELLLERGAVLLAENEQIAVYRYDAAGRKEEQREKG